MTGMLINIDEKRMVDARELHCFLEVGRRFNDWIRNRIEEYGFEKGNDYRLLKIEYGENQLVRYDYKITLSMAKELCMVERNEKGREARKYFIAVEEEYRRSKGKPTTSLEVLQESIAKLVEQERKLKVHDAKIIKLEERVEELNPDTGFRTVRAYAKRVGIKTSREQNRVLGYHASSICRGKGVVPGKVADEGYDAIGSYPIDVLEQVFKNSGLIK